MDYVRFAITNKSTEVDHSKLFHLQSKNNFNITLNFRYMHKRAEIDYAIAKRVNKLYKVLEHRFGASGDIKIW